MRTRALAAAILLLGLSGAPRLAAGAPGEPEAAPVGAMETRSYPVHFRPLTDAADLVGSILSEGGEVTLQPRLKCLVVRDLPAVHDQIPPLLESFDLPPRSVDVSITLALATQAAAGRNLPPGELHTRDRGVFEAVAPVTRWTAFDPLGKRSLVGVEGAVVTTDLSDDYRVVFEVESVTDRWVNFRRFSVQRLDRGPDGEERVHNLYSAAITIKVGQPLLVGAAQAPNSTRALFVNLEVSPR